MSIQRCWGNTKVPTATDPPWVDLLDHIPVFQNKPPLVKTPGERSTKLGGKHKVPVNWLLDKFSREDSKTHWPRAPHLPPLPPPRAQAFQRPCSGKMLSHLAHLPNGRTVSDLTSNTSVFANHSSCRVGQNATQAVILPKTFQIASALWRFPLFLNQMRVSPSYYTSYPHLCCLWFAYVVLVGLFSISIASPDTPMPLHIHHDRQTETETYMCTTI